MDADLFETHLGVLEAAGDLAGQIAAFDRIIGDNGAKGFVAAAWEATDPRLILLYASQREPFSQLDVESAWWADDPIVARLMAGAAKPFDYAEAWANPLATAAERWDVLVAAGLDKGIVFPVSRPPYVGSLLAFAADEDALARLEASQAMLHLLANYFHALVVDRAPEESKSGIIRNTLTVNAQVGRKYKLSERELVCLQWLANGKTSGDIAVIESLSVHTVRHYLRTAMAKLGAATQAQAIALAIKYSMIDG